MLKVERNMAYDVKDIFEKREFTHNGYTLRYRLYVPKNYDCGETYPLMVFLHGAGERGVDNELHLTVAIQNMFNDPTSPVYDAIVIAPQCPEDSKWVLSSWEKVNYSIADVPESVHLETLCMVLDEIAGYYNVDEDRVYVTGISMGGFGTWDLLARHGARFAAGMPVCGGGDPAYAKLLARIPIRTFHGSWDPAVPVEGTRKMFAAIKKAGGEVIDYTELDRWQHGIWDHVYSTRENIDWLFSQSREERRKKAEKAAKAKKLAAIGTVAGAALSVAVALLAGKKKKKK